MTVDEMTIDEMTVDEMTIDEMTLDWMSLDEMTIVEMSLDWMSLDEMAVDKKTFKPGSPVQCTFLYLHLRSTHFLLKNIIHLFYKTSYLNEEINCTEPLVRLPCLTLSN